MCDNSAMKLVLFSGSLRTDSLNKKFLSNAYQALPAEHRNESKIIELRDFNIPAYDGDIEARGIPPDVKKLSDILREAQGLIISTPEYNGSIASPLKTIIDWVSRVKPVAWSAKHVLLLSASPGALGGVRGLWHTRVPFEVLGCFVYPEMFGLPKAEEAFDEKGLLKNPQTQDRLALLINKYLEHILP